MLIFSFHFRKTVQKAIAQIVGTVVKHELGNGNGWPEFFAFVEQHIKSDDSKQREVRVLLKCIVT